jgi:hypothetical protein
VKVSIKRLNVCFAYTQNKTDIYNRMDPYQVVIMDPDRLGLDLAPTTNPSELFEEEDFSPPIWEDGAATGGDAIYVCHRELRRTVHVITPGGAVAYTFPIGSNVQLTRLRYRFNNSYNKKAILTVPVGAVALAVNRPSVPIMSGNGANEGRPTTPSFYPVPSPESFAINQNLNNNQIRNSVLIPSRSYREQPEENSRNSARNSGNTLRGGKSRRSKKSRRPRSTRRKTRR